MRICVNVTRKIYDKRYKFKKYNKRDRKSGWVMFDATEFDEFLSDHLNDFAMDWKRCYGTLSRMFEVSSVKSIETFIEIMSTKNITNKHNVLNLKLPAILTQPDGKEIWNVIINNNLLVDTANTILSSISQISHDDMLHDVFIDTYKYYLKNYPNCYAESHTCDFDGRRVILYNIENNNIKMTMFSIKKVMPEYIPIQYFFTEAVLANRIELADKIISKYDISNSHLICEYGDEVVFDAETQLESIIYLHELYMMDRFIITDHSINCLMIRLMCTPESRSEPLIVYLMHAFPVEVMDKNIELISEIFLQKYATNFKKHFKI